SIETGNANLSNHGVLRMYVRPNEETYTYDFTLDNSGSYDIWYLGNEKIDYLSWFDYGIDVSDKDTLTQAGCLASSDTVYTYNLDNDLNIQWHKAAENVNISSGHHVLTFREKYRSGNANLFGISDCIAIVPSGANWTPTTADKSVQGRVNLDAHMLAYNLGNNAVTASADIPQMGAAGSRYSYASNDENVIGNDLTVHRADLYDKTCQLTPKITQGTVSKEASSITVTVKRMKEYSIRDFKITDEHGNEITELTPNKKVTASAKIYDDVSVSKSGAVIILALYDSQNRFVACGTGSINAMTATEQEIMAEMTLPGGDVTGYSLKAFIWDSLTDLNVLY
ncbi:MAG: hypothetical protein PUF72_09470, partial [Clostridiales bacterium]|nr:hypothetical protein [Clostridiales bacterium]